MDVSVVTLMRTAYLSAAATVVLVSAIPALRSRFLEYGARASDSGSLQRTSPLRKQHASYASQILDVAASWTVPHGWFISFYALSVSCSLIWASVLFSRGIVIKSPLTPDPPARDSMSFDQIIVAWLMLFIQGSRRLYECMNFSTASDSRMWIGHWVMGLFFYLGTSVAVWIEGSETLKGHTLAASDFILAAPSVRTFCAVPIFSLASGFQYDCHAYLASLRKSKFSKGGRPVLVYQFPRHPAFNKCLTPHYFAECLIYLALTIQAAPAGNLVNWTLACALAFVVVNLGVTANGTKTWYQHRFGSTAVQGRSRMIPFIY